MGNCIGCDNQITSNFGTQTTKDGGQVCKNCMNLLGKARLNIALKIKKHTISEVLLELNPLLSKKLMESSKSTDIAEVLNKIGIDNIGKFLGRKEIKALPSILSNNETLENLIQGIYQGKQGVLVLTSIRLLFVDKGFFTGIRVEDFPLNKISSIQYETGILSGKIKIHTSGNIASIENLDKRRTQPFAETVRSYISNLEKKEVPVQSNNNSDVISQIEQLGQLKEKGIITVAEFEKKKKELIERI